MRTSWYAPRSMTTRTKIVATIGPASERENILLPMIRSGLSVARLNFSHGSHEEHGKRVAAIRSAARKAHTTVAILQDLGGPKIRIGDFSSQSVELIPGATFTLTTDDVIGNETRVSITYMELPKFVKKGSRILLNDGKNELRVVSVSGNDIKTEVVVGGTIKGRRGVNIPGAYLPIRSLTAKDRKDVLFGVKHNVEFFGLSFVRTERDIADLRVLLKKHKSTAKIVAKIETQEAVEHLEEIIAAADGVMVARGDLAVEIQAPDVPLVQKRIIDIARRRGKSVIVATHMLESMINSPTPTRAEVSDVANAVLDGTDAVMLSGESALGEYPVEAVRTMSAIASVAEESGLSRTLTVGNAIETTDTVSEAAIRAAERAQARVIVAFTESGLTARMLARFRPSQHIVAFTPHQYVADQLNLSFGTQGVKTRSLSSLDMVIKQAREHVLTHKLAGRGDTIVIAAGVPFGKTGGTNMLLVQTL